MELFSTQGTKFTKKILQANFINILYNYNRINKTRNIL